MAELSSCLISFQFFRSFGPNDRDSRKSSGLTDRATTASFKSIRAVTTIIATTVVILSAAYLLWAVQRVFLADPDADPKPLNPPTGAARAAAQAA